MSEVLNDYGNLKLEWSLKLSTEGPLTYVRRLCTLRNEILFCVEIPWPLLNLWSKLLSSTSGEDVNYVDLLNSTVEDGWFMLKRDCDRLKELLRKHAAHVKHAYTNTKGRKRIMLDDKLYKVSVQRGEIESMEINKSELRECNEKLEHFKRKCSDLEEEKKKLYEDMMEEKGNLEREISDLTSVNKELRDYIETLEKTDYLKCQGKKITEVGGKQKGRKLRFIKNKAQCALWFSKSFGLEISQLKLQDEEGCSYSLDYENSTKGDKDAVEKILFLLDKFCVGDAFYHELSIISEDLPKSYLVKQLRGNLNKTYHIERTEGGYPGAKLDFTPTLASHIEELLVHKPELSDGTVQVKLSGDGARMTRSTNFMMFSFSLLQLEEVVMSSKSNKTVAIINGSEDYDTLKGALPNLSREINELIKKGSILINGKEVKLEFFLGGDMKFLLMIMGLNSATADYACVWCKVHKENRWDTSKGMAFYSEDPQRRTLDEIKKNSKRKDNYGCIYQPLIDIELDHVVPDELHLLLRVTDRLLENVIDEVLEKSVIEDFNRQKGQPKGVLLAKFVQGVNSCGIPFHVWYKKNADGSYSNILEYTSLVGSQKKKLLHKLPAKFQEYLYEDTCAIVSEIWTSFADYYQLITYFKLTDDNFSALFEKGKVWIELFCSLRNIRPGYTRARVTPYMHVMAYHVPHFVKKYGCFKKFTGQGVEKNNDDAKRVLFHKSNKWDAAKDILLTESRQWDLKEHERQKGTYTKRKLEYWDRDINIQRKERRLLSKASTSQEEAVNDNDVSGAAASTDKCDYNNFTVLQLRDIVKEKGLNRKGLSKLKKSQLVALLEY